MLGFDGKICPGCDDTMRGAYALLFNARNRYPEASMMEKLWDCKQFHAVLPDPPADAHPAIHAMRAVHAKLMQAMEGVVQDGTIIRWVPGVLQRITHLEPEWTDALVAYEEIKEQHFHDRRHSHGELNELRESRGSKHALWGRRPEDTRYHHYVSLWTGSTQPEPDLVHTRCGAQHVIVDHFKDELRRDPTFYGKFWCLGCRSNVPWAEMEVLFDA